MEIVFAADPPARLSRRNFGLVFPLDVIPIAIVGDGYTLGREGVVIPWMDESGVFFFSLLFFFHRNFEDYYYTRFIKRVNIGRGISER